MIEHLWADQQREEYQKNEREKIKNTLDASSSHKVEREWNNIINEINNSENPLDTTLQKIDEGKDVAYIMKSLKAINFISNSGDFNYDRIKNSEAKKQIANAALNKWFYKDVLDSWESLNDLIDQDKDNIAKTFKWIIDGSQSEQKEEYYDYLDKKIVSIWTKDPVAWNLFHNILMQKEIDLNNQLARNLGDNPKWTSIWYLFWWSDWSGLDDDFDWWKSDWFVDYDWGNSDEWDNDLGKWWEGEFDDGDGDISWDDEEWWDHEFEDEDMFWDPYNLDWDPYGIWSDWWWDNWWHSKDDDL